MWKVITSFIVAILCGSLMSVVAQAKPKFNRNRLQQKQENKNLVTTYKGNKSKKNKKKTNKHITIGIEPLYVYINGKTEEETVISYKGGCVNYGIATNIANGLNYGYFYFDGDGYKVFDPTWCHFEDTDFDKFKITFEPNETYEERVALFLLGDNQAETTAGIFIRQEAKPITVSGLISNAYLRHNLEIGNNKNVLEINANISLQNAKDLSFIIYAIIVDEDGTRIQAKYDYPLYRSSDRTLFTSNQFNSYSEYYYGNITMQIPNDAMELWKPGFKHQLRCELFIQCIESNEIIRNTSYSIPFKTYEKKHKILTKN